MNLHLQTPFKAPMVRFGFAAAAIVMTLGLAAIIDGWAFKVPNWLTLSMVVSGWLLGLLTLRGRVPFIALVAVVSVRAMAVTAAESSTTPAGGAFGALLAETALSCWSFVSVFPLLAPRCDRCDEPASS